MLKMYEGADVQMVGHLDAPSHRNESMSYGTLWIGSWVSPRVSLDAVV
jgi:hypothetical protein